MGMLKVGEGRKCGRRFPLPLKALIVGSRASVHTLQLPYARYDLHTPSNPLLDTQQASFSNVSYSKFGLLQQPPRTIKAMLGR